MADKPPIMGIDCRHGLDGCAAFVEARKEEYIRRLLDWAEVAKEESGGWAGFLKK